MSSKYSIKDLERLTGIKAHTLRVWEQRYEILRPERTDTNIRFYNNDDLRRILNISLLNNNGYKISAIAKQVAGKDSHWSSGCGTVDSAVDFDTRGPGFASSHR